MEELSPSEALRLLYAWQFWARRNQLTPTNIDWFVWLVLAGRGFGKTRTGAEYVRGEVEAGYNGRIHLIAPTAADVRDVMIEGESGLLEVCPPWNRPKYEPSKRRLTWPNGATAITFSAEQPERLRGPQAGLVWADEVGAWRYPETWDMAMFGLRAGLDPKAVVTTTPRPTPLVKELVSMDGVVITKGNTYDNAANLAPAFYSHIIKKYEGTRLGKQEIHAELLEDTPGALWNLDLIDAHRFTLKEFQAIELVRIAISIDPAVTSKQETSNETGIIAAGIDKDGEGYILADRSGIYTPLGWAKKAFELFGRLKADRIVAEVNNGGDLVEANLRAVHKRVPYTKVHASRGKRVRAEPVMALYEQGLVHHVGVFAVLEDQMTTWDAEDGSPSPDRLDALVWCLTYLMLVRVSGKAKSRQG